MAEKTKNNKTQEVVVNEENVVEQVKAGNLLKDKNVSAALDEIEKEQDEARKREAKDAIMCAKYINTKELINLRARRAEEKITKAALAKSKDLLDQLLGGKITPSEYKNLRKDATKEKSDAMSKADEELVKNMNELRRSYTGQWKYRCEWDY